MNFSFVLIAKNEGKTLPRFVNSVKHTGAEIVVVDTGSTDNTVSIAKKLGCKVHSVGDRFLTKITPQMAKSINAFVLDKDKPKIVKPGDKQFDFSRARNFAAKLASNDFVFMPDCDEVFTKFDTHKISEIIKGGVNQLEYNFVYSHDENGSPLVQFMHSKAYDRTKMKWVGIIHEVLSHDVKNATRAFLPPDIIHLEHFQNPETDRGHYLKGLALSVLQEPDNDRNLHYFGRELYYQGYYKSAITQLIDHVNLANNKYNKTYDTFLKKEASQSYIYMGYCYGNLGLPIEQMMQFSLAIMKAPDQRAPYLRMAEFYQHNNQWSAAKAFAIGALQIPKDDFYANNEKDFTTGPHEILYLAGGYTGDISLARYHLGKCLEFEPKNQTYLSHIKYYLDLPTISVIIPHIKGTRKVGLKRVMDSIKAQSYPQDKIEILVIEGDETVPVKVNKGVAKATGSFIVYASDDIEFGENDFAGAMYDSLITKTSLVAFDTGVRNDKGFICEHFLVEKITIKPRCKGKLFDERLHHVGVDDLLWARYYANRMVSLKTNTKHYHFSRQGSGIKKDSVTTKGWKNVDKDRKMLAKILKEEKLEGKL